MLIKNSLRRIIFSKVEKSAKNGLINQTKYHIQDIFSFRIISKIIVLIFFENFWIEFYYQKSFL